MASSITALTALPANFSRVGAARVAPVEEVASRSNAFSKRDQVERVIEGELLQRAPGVQHVNRTDFSIDDIVGAQTDINFDPRFTSTRPIASTVVAANDAVAAYVSGATVFTGVQQRQVDTFV
ncbi:MAG: hypothetical protein GXP21_02700 [Gammaproteobacteria bacterium]|nr:hypothetical protein [Gammaproteobacteria bacterium]